eukprot:TRINITY_DN1037_c0_g1_i2.p1 TRINITY_DN1037_c0_g1~~TRINITY_DN1037_c0_g1_i2.p1  ORF type:complete len:310 (-),score=45.56 TRINITY_DN1037_c0_g1_i2:139-1026(-)
MEAASTTLATDAVVHCPTAEPSSASVIDAGGITALTVQGVSGRTLAEIEPPLPSTVKGLKDAISILLGVQAEFVKLINGGALLAADEDLVDAYASQIVTVVIDSSAAFLWDTIRNPDVDQLAVEGSHVRCPEMRNDYINVVTQAPLPAGRHFVEFVMHCKEDEQWCGIVQDKALGWGKKVSGHSREFEGCFYYCGCRAESGRLIGFGLLDDSEMVPFASVGSGDIIGLAVDCDRRAVAFSCNGHVQGTCKLPPHGPLYLLTHVDTRKDHVELRRQDVEDAPLELMQALSKQINAS